MNITRHDFSTGLIGEELRWRSDKETYTRSLVQSQNMLPTPYGGVRRRPPLVSIGTLPAITADSVIYYPNGARSESFIHSSEYRYLAIFVTYSAEGYDDIKRVVITDTEGNQKGVVSSPYTQEEVDELDVKQSVSDMYIAHRNHPPFLLNRVSDTEWNMLPHNISGGPFMDENEYPDIKMSVGLSQWQDDIQYIVGDVVIPASTSVGTISWIGGAWAFQGDNELIADYPDAANWQIQTNDLTFFYYPLVDYKNALYWYPYTYLQVDKAFYNLADVVVGAPIAVNLGFEEEGGEDTYSKSGVITEMLEGTTYAYIKVNFGWVGIRPDNWTTYYDGVPGPAFDANIESWFQATALEYYGGDYAPLYPVFVAEGYRALPTLPTPGEAGALVTPVSGNIIQTESDTNYKALQGNIGQDPTEAGGNGEDITEIAHVETNRARIYSGPGVPHNLIPGNTVEITGTTAYNGNYTVLSTIDEWRFDIAVLWTGNEATGHWEQTGFGSDYWEVTTDDESNILKIECDGAFPFEAADEDERLIYLNKSDDFSMSGAWAYTETEPISDAVYAVGRLILRTSGVWTGEIQLRISRNGGNDWHTVSNFKSNSDSNNTIIEYEITENDTLVRVEANDATFTAGTMSWTLDYPDGYSTIYKIQKFLTDTAVIARVVTGDNDSFSTSLWALGAWGGNNKYPGTVKIYEDRLWYAGSVGEPFKHWGSVVSKYWNFLLGTFVTSAIIFQARSDASTRISWVEPKDNLFFGTDFGEFAAVNLDQSNVLSATNPPKMDRYTSEGSARISAKMLGRGLAYVSADKKRLKLLQYDAAEQDGYRSYDMTHLNPTVAGSGFVGQTLQRTPFPVLWLWTADGNAVSFTFDQEHNVIAFSQHSTVGGSIKSLCVIPDENGVDEIFAVVQRDNTKCIMVNQTTGEQIQMGSGFGIPGAPPYIEAGDDPGYSIQYRGYFSFNLYSTAGGEGDEIASTPPTSHPFDNRYWTATDPYTDDYRSLPLNYHIEKLDYSEADYTDNLGGVSPEEITSNFEPTPLSRGPNFLEGKMKFRCTRGHIYVNESNGGEISVDRGQSWETLDYSKLTPDANGLYTGMIEFRTHSGYVDYSTVEVRTTAQTALNIMAINLDIDNHDMKKGT